MFCISLFALVLSLATQGLSGKASSDFELFGKDSLSSLPQLDHNQIQSQESKNSSKITLISNDNAWLFSPITSDFLLSNSSSHYLPIYSLNRKKQHFLQI
jgi:hypothetical protein